MISAFDEKYLDAGEVKEVNILMDKALSLLNGYINYLAKAKISNNSKNQNLVREPNVSYMNDNSKLANENNDLPEPPIS